MILTSLLLLSLVGDSLTLSPIGLTFHGYDVRGLKKNAPRKLDRNAQWTWHPEIALTYKTPRWQYSAFWFKDTIDNDSGGFFLGPKWDFYKYFSIGAIAGALFRNPQMGYNVIAVEVNKDLQILPLIGATVSVDVPVTKHFSWETNVFSNYFINHATSGVKWTW